MFNTYKKASVMENKLYTIKMSKQAKLVDFVCGEISLIWDTHEHSKLCTREANLF